MRNIKKQNQMKAKYKAELEETKKRNYGKFYLNKWDIFRAVESQRLQNEERFQ